MDEIRILRDHAEYMASQSPPKLHVAGAVLATLRSNFVHEADDWLAGSIRPLFALATAASLLAVSICLFAQQSLAELQDPFSSLFSPLVVALQ
jgi:hypothetical protein